MNEATDGGEGGGGRSGSEKVGKVNTQVNTGTGIDKIGQQLW